MSESKISVIIPVRNGADHIEKCLEAVFSQSYPPFEVVMVDGHSTDDTVPRAQKFPIKLLYESYRTRGGACQVGVEHAQGEYVAFTDADCIPDKDWLANLVREFSNGIVGVGGGIKNIGEGLWVRSFNLILGTFLGSGRSVQGRFFEKKQFVRSISGSNSIYRRQDVLNAGGFDASPIGEDRALNYRLSRTGKLLYTPDAVIQHDHRRGLVGLAKVMWRYGRQRQAMKIMDLQVVPVFVIPLIFLSLIFTLWVFIGLLLWYIVIVAAMGAKFAIQEKDYRLIFSIPVAYAVEHTSYIAGFWRELIIPYKRLWREKIKE